MRKRKRNSLLLSAMLIAMTTLFSYTINQVQASSCFRDRDNGINLGNGRCNPGEGASECVDFGDFVLEICPPVQDVKQFPIQATCKDPQTDSEVPCSEWSYVLTRKDDRNTDQKRIMFQVPVSAGLLEVPKRSKVFTDGQGDPPTGFGKFDLSNNVLKIPVKFPDSKRKVYISYKTTPAAPGENAMLLKIGNEKFFGLIQGPADQEIAEITKTTEIVTTKDGISLVVETDLAGNLVSAKAFDRNGEPVSVDVIPQNQAFICVPTVSNPNLNFPDPSEYDCQVVISIPDRTNTRAGENSLCDYWYRGTLIQYPCN